MLLERLNILQRDAVMNDRPQIFPSIRLNNDNISAHDCQTVLAQIENVCATTFELYDEQLCARRNLMQRNATTELLDVRLLLCLRAKVSWPCACIKAKGIIQGRLQWRLRIIV